MNGGRFARHCILVTVIGATLVLAQQRKPSLQIDLPADGTIVNPGQTITVSVLSPGGDSFRLVALVGEAPIGLSGLVNFAHSVPATFSITIPSDVSACRRYTVGAMGVTTAEESVQSDLINLDVERPDTPISISSPQLPSLTLQTGDPPFPLKILATFPDHNLAEVTDSSYVTYQSSNPAVAAVERYGGIYGGIKVAGPGTASIDVTYRSPNGNAVRTSVPVTVSSPGSTE